DKSGKGCPTPVVGRALQLHTGEVVPLPCGRNSCPVCRRRNVLVTAAMVGLDAVADAPQLALTTTTRDWIDDATLREGTAQYVRAVRREVEPGFQYLWQREWTTGRGRRADGKRRTHKHWLTKRVPVEHKAELVEIAVEVWKRLAGADQHFVQEVWDAGGAARYLAGLVGHHLKAAQAPPAGWRGRRVGQSRGYYGEAASELRVRAEEVVRDQRLAGLLEREVEELIGSESVEFDEERGELRRVLHVP